MTADGEALIQSADDFRNSPIWDCRCCLGCSGVFFIVCLAVGPAPPAPGTDSTV